MYCKKCPYPKRKQHDIFHLIGGYNQTLLIAFNRWVRHLKFIFCSSSLVFDSFQQVGLAVGWIFNVCILVFKFGINFLMFGSNTTKDIKYRNVLLVHYKINIGILNTYLKCLVTTWHCILILLYGRNGKYYTNISILLVRVICEKYRLRGEANFPSRHQTVLETDIFCK